MAEENKDELIPKERYNNRRRMAWLSIIALLSAIIALMTPYIPIERINAIENIIIHFCWGMVTIIGGYMGFTALPDVVTKMRRNVR